jgi:hypothetical protein
MGTAAGGPEVGRRLVHWVERELGARAAAGGVVALGREAAGRAVDDRVVTVEWSGASRRLAPAIARSRARWCHQNPPWVVFPEAFYLEELSAT